MNEKFNALIEVLANLIWEEIEERVNEQVREIIRDTEFEVDIRHSSVEIDAEVTPRI
jgi:hypothetical protein